MRLGRQCRMALGRPLGRRVGKIRHDRRTVGQPPALGHVAEEQKKTAHSNSSLQSLQPGSTHPPTSRILWHGQSLVALFSGGWLDASVPVVYKAGKHVPPEPVVRLFVVVTEK